MDIGGLQAECIIIDVQRAVPRSSPKQLAQMRAPARSPSFDLVISSGAWLLDEHIDSAQYLLALQFESSNTVFQSCTTVEAGSGGANFGIPDAKATFVQILLIQGSHWVTLSNKGCEDGTVKIYVSMSASDLCGDAKRAVCWLMFYSETQVTFQWVDIARQTGGNDCGLFVITIATSLCHVINPTEAVFDQSQMRPYLIRCLRRQEMTPFPLRLYRKPNKEALRIMSVQRVCVCKQPDTWDACILCQNCARSFHPRCVPAQPIFICNTFTDM